MEQFNQVHSKLRETLDSAKTVSSLKGALEQTLSLVEMLAAELSQLRQEHDELDEYVGDIEDELEGIEDALDELEGDWDMDGEDDYGEDHFDRTEKDDESEEGKEGEEEKPAGKPDNITPLNFGKKGKKNK